ncbi:hypothetical protein INR49_005051 [Caranx melampygus]|nr:hypothetical protein INR49_005051 [Caranx melampygus]
MNKQKINLHRKQTRVGMFLCCAVCVFCPLCLPFDPLAGLGPSSSSDLVLLFFFNTACPSYRTSTTNPAAAALSLGPRHL